MRNKRRWAWKKKHVRKHRLQKYFHMHGPSKEFRSQYHRGNRGKELMDLRKILRGVEDVDTSPKFHPSSADWDWY